MYCQECGAQLPNNATFCVQCGRNLATAKPRRSPGVHPSTIALVLLLLALLAGFIYSQLFTRFRIPDLIQQPKTENANYMP
jgi:predicted amidophosphoribosyltransferase